jgi:plasmid replication initiation protein
MEKIRVYKLQEKNLVAQANSLIEARYTITKNEQLLLFAMISLINPDDKEFLTFSVTIDQLSKILNINRATAIREFDKITDRLMSRVIKLQTPDGWEKIQWVSKAVLNRNKGTVLVRFHNDLKPYLLELKKAGNFSQYRLALAVQFRSIYTIRIYQIIKEYQLKKRTEFKFSLEDFRNIMLGEGSKKYSVFNKFKERVIESAQKELGQIVGYDVDGKTPLYKSDLNFDLVTSRTNRRISDLTFIIKHQQIEATKPTKNNEDNDKDLPAIIQEYHQIGLTTEQVKPYLDERGEKALKNTLNKIKKDYESGKVTNNLAGYAFKLLKENAGQKTPEEIAEEKRKEAQRLKKIEAQRQQIKEELITTLADEFSRIERERFITSLSEEESKRIFSEITVEYEKSMVLPLIEKDGLASNIIALKLQDFIPQFKENKEKYISEKLKESGLL